MRSKTQYGVTMPDGAACGEGEGEGPLAPPPTVPIYQPCKYIQTRVPLYSGRVFAGLAKPLDRHTTRISKDHEQCSYHYVRA